MKIYKEMYVKQVVAVICDIHPDAEASINSVDDGDLQSNAFSTLTMEFGYGSDMDGKRLELHLSDEAVHEILGLLQRKYGREKIESHLIDCPLI